MSTIAKQVCARCDREFWSDGTEGFCPDCEQIRRTPCAQCGRPIGDEDSVRFHYGDDGRYHARCAGME